MKRLYTPFKVNQLELKNRVIMSPMSVGHTVDGFIMDDVVEFYRRRALGGVGLIIFANMQWDKVRYNPNHGAMLTYEKYIPSLKKLTDAIHEGGSKVFAQLMHRGRCANRASIQGEQAVAPSPIPGRFTHFEMPKELTVEEIKQFVDWQAHAAVIAKKAGFDGIEIETNSGYLYGQFFSPLTNHRTDEYGGSLDNRMRFMRMCLEEVMNAAAATGTSVLVKHNMYDGFKGGIEIPESIEIAREIERWKVNGIVLSGGFVSKAPMAVMRGLIPIYTMSYYSPLWLRAFIRYCGPFMIRQFPFSECYFLEDAKKFREALQLPLIYVGGLVSREGIERALDSGFELVQMARALVNDPAFVNKLREGDAATRSECDHRNYCIARMYSIEMACHKHIQNLPKSIVKEIEKLEYK